MRECATCKFANRSGNEDFVFCTKWQKEANESKMTSELYALNILIYKEPQLNGVIGIGWGYPSQTYNKEVNWHEKGTVSASMMWNEQICVQANAGCSQYKERGK